VSSFWLFATRNREAQDLRLRARIEEDAFARMTSDWRRLGFPFERLVPSLATAIGSSCDRPLALAQLMGIILNDGVHKATASVRTLRFAGETPYHTVFDAPASAGEQVMAPAVAQVLRRALERVVDQGTARRIAGAFVLPDGTRMPVGGKTGSGDNRFKVFARNGEMIDSRPVNRTATFVFYIGDRYFGVVTALVLGPESGNYGFTSALPVTILRILAPVMNARFAPTGPAGRKFNPPGSLVQAPPGRLRSIEDGRPGSPDRKTG
jgi:membrane peptidoglycan carboxypeptidase